MMGQLRRDNFFLAMQSQKPKELFLGTTSQGICEEFSVSFYQKLAPKILITSAECKFLVMIILNHLFNF